MKLKKPFELKFVMMVYNFFQVVSNLFIGIYVSQKDYSKKCHMP